MKPILTSLLMALSVTATHAQPVRVSNAPAPAWETLTDDFAEATKLDNWISFSSTEQFPDKVRSVSVQNGVLRLQPYASGWYGDYQAPFLFKMVTGDFDVRTRVKVSGTSGTLPQSEWSLAGLMVRQPKRTTSETWQPRQENWLFLTTGIAEPKGVPVFEVKTTNNSLSNLKLRPAKEGWVELRIVRVQASFILLYRYEGEPWTVLERFYRPLLPSSLQVGINAYSGWNNVPMEYKMDPAKFNTALLKDVATDLVLEVDYVQYRKPALNEEKLKALTRNGFGAPYYTPSNLLTDYSVSNEQLLQIIGN